MKNIVAAATIKARRRHHLTLVEILLALTIIVMLGGVIAINVRGAVTEQNFHNDVQKVVEELRLSQELMLIAAADITISFEDNVMFFISQDKLDPRIDKMIKKKVPLKYVREISLNQQTNPQLNFMSRGSVMPQGNLTFKGVNGELRSIIFTGAPAPIKIGPLHNNIKQSFWDPLIEVTRFEITPTQSNPA